MLNEQDWKKKTNKKLQIVSDRAADTKQGRMREKIRTLH